MIDVIINTFKLFGYESLNSKEIQIFKSSLIEDYWVIYQGSPNKLLERKEQSHLLSLCKKVCSEPSMDKNINVICLWNIDSVNTTIIRQLHQAEEDIYFFKKHVLYFTTKEENSFNVELSKNSLETILKQFPTDPNVFQIYKSNIHSESWENLLYRLCIKLTFIPIAKTSSDEMSDIYMTHDLAINNNKNHERLKELNSIALGLTSKEFELEPESLLDLFIGKLERKEE
ncbi:hypothetical protein GNP82_14945 [Aliivibrio fischeri]|uniref:ABC-three component system middle component 1 n=1 Tax=Aliivibrio fischeri TaxID=668 RepID=UPI0012D88F48|nr:ABC-three component system middle component 1 [Aliivibrio fischeri]MUK38854.1 hypothetical protein [Aliivibrio fischeri]MUL05881.1 hypothetical protein [Aliivibrio fischeri]